MKLEKKILFPSSLAPMAAIVLSLPFLAVTTSENWYVFSNKFESDHISNCIDSEESIQLQESAKQWCIKLADWVLDEELHNLVKQELQRDSEELTYFSYRNASWPRMQKL